jgi:FKBP-type peptidyl-prolyl cis-trans isomerase FkpA
VSSNTGLGTIGMATFDPTIDITPGVGPKLDPDMIVTVHYTGWVYDPVNQRKLQEFDSTIKRRQPFTFKLGETFIIERLRTVVAQMLVHERRPRLTIPPALAYGSEMKVGRIPANSTLIFDLELLEAMPGRFYPNVLETVGAGKTPSNGKKVEGSYYVWPYEHTAGDRKGRMFESKYPFEFVVGDGRAMKWLHTSVVEMKEKGTRTVYVPHFETFGIGAAVPRGTALVIEVKLDKVT